MGRGPRIPVKKLVRCACGTWDYRTPCIFCKKAQHSRDNYHKKVEAKRLSMANKEIVDSEPVQKD